jgi:hypothetical protein
MLKIKIPSLKSPKVTILKDWTTECWNPERYNSHRGVERHFLRKGSICFGCMQVELCHARGTWQKQTLLEHAKSFYTFSFVNLILSKCIVQLTLCVGSVCVCTEKTWILLQEIRNPFWTSAFVKGKISQDPSSLGNCLGCGDQKRFYSIS